MTGDSLGALLLKVLADPTIAENTAQMSKRLVEEDGTLNAHKAIERAITSFPYPWGTKKDAMRQ